MTENHNSTNGESEASAQPNDSPAHCFGPEIADFIIHIESLRTTLPIIVDVIQDAIEKTDSALGVFLNDHSVFVQDENDPKTYHFPKPLPDGLSHPLIRHIDEVKKAVLSSVLVPRSFFVSLVSQFDAYLGGLLRVLFRIQPNLLNHSDKLLSLEELLRFSSLNEATDYFIEKEVVKVLRMSHSEPFEWLEKKAGMKLRVDLPSWPTFIEVMRDGIYSFTAMALFRTNT